MAIGGLFKLDLRQIVARHITIPPTGVGGFFRSDLRDIRLQLRVRVEYPRRRSRLVFRSSLLDERLNFPIGTLTVCVGGILKLRRLTSAVSHVFLSFQALPPLRNFFIRAVVIRPHVPA